MRYGPWCPGNKGYPRLWPVRHTRFPWQAYRDLPHARPGARLDLECKGGGTSPPNPYQPQFWPLRGNCRPSGAVSARASRSPPEKPRQYSSSLTSSDKPPSLILLLRKTLSGASALLMRPPHLTLPAPCFSRFLLKNVITWFWKRLAMAP